MGLKSGAGRYAVKGLWAEDCQPGFYGISKLEMILRSSRQSCFTDN